MHIVRLTERRKEANCRKPKLRVRYLSVKESRSILAGLKGNAHSFNTDADRNPCLVTVEMAQIPEEAWETVFEEIDSRDL